MTVNLESGTIPYSNVTHSEQIDFKKIIELSAVRGKTILITGGASGFGLACAQHWASHGANLMLGDINSGAGIKAVADLRATTGNDNHHFFTCDVTQWRSQANFFKEAAKASPHGGIDIVIANAGIADGQEAELFEGPPDYSLMDDPIEPNITRTLNVNLKGVFFTTHLALSYLPRNPGSQPCSVDQKPSPRDRQLILISSIAGIVAFPRLSPYCSAKHGVVGLFRSLRVTAPVQHGVRVNMVNPYFVKTGIVDAMSSALLAGGAMAKIEDVVGILTRFVTDQSIIGRGCVVGSQGTSEETSLVKLPHDGPVWDVYADDFMQTDVFVRRIIGITNLQRQARGWIGMYKDLFVAFTSPVLRLFSR